MLPKLGILAGGGLLPDLLIASCQAAERPFFVLTFNGQPQPENLTGLAKEAHTRCPLGALGRALATLQNQEVTEVVMAGHLQKPSLFDLKPDPTGLRFLSTLKSRHDDAILSGMADFWEKNGFKVVGAHEVLPELLLPAGCLTRTTPTQANRQDVELALRAARTLGELDIGQAVMVKDGVILGVEAVEGTNALIERCAGMRGKKNRGGILVKLMKPGQDTRVDMPALGPETLALLARHNFTGVAAQAGKTLLFEREQAIKMAQKAGMFLLGVEEVP